MGADPVARKMGFRTIKEEVLNRIRNGVWPPDTLLPSEAELADEFSTTRTTVNRALRELAEEGYLDRRRKAGTRVQRTPIRHARLAIPQPEDEVAASGQPYRYALIRREARPAPDWLAAKLSLSAAQQSVIHVRAMHYAGSTPFQFEDRWIVENSVPQAASEGFDRISPGSWLIREVPFSNAEVSFSATAADMEISSFLEVDVGDPLFLVERITWLEGNPVTFVRLFHGKGYKMKTVY